MPALNPYLSFRSNAREALDFYYSVLGGSLEISTFGSMPDMGHDPSESDLVMHGQITTEDGMILMASDTPSVMQYQPAQGISVSLSGIEADRLRGVWDGLSDGATVLMPLAPAPWGGEFGMLVDRFGITWMVNVNGS